MNQQQIGKFISEQRKLKHLTQEQLAEKLGVSKNAVSKWERGLNLPDASIMQKLCDIIDISLNELFAGSKLSEENVVIQSEHNILSILNLQKHKTEIYKAVIAFMLIIITVCLCRFVLVKFGYVMDDNLKYSQIYISGDGNIKGNVDINKFGKLNISFDVGANKYGDAVFKNPQKALKTLKKDYSDGLKLIQSEFKLLPLNRFNFRQYKTYGWQVSSGTEQQKEQARFVTSFMDIYENSFN